MIVFRNRLLSYLLLSLALAAAFAPFTGYRGYSWQPDPIAGFEVWRYPLAAVFAAGGLFSLRGLYKVGPGIRLNPAWGGYFGDVLFILFLSFCAYCSLEYLFGKVFDMVSFLDNEGVTIISSVGFLPAAAFFAMFNTLQSGQSVEVDEDGIRVHLSGDSSFASWENVRGFELSDSFSIGGGSEMVYAKKLQTRLIIHTDQEKITLIEANPMAKKQKILQLIRSYAPERLHHDIDNLNHW